MFLLNLQIITVNFKSQMVIQHVIVRITKLCSYVNILLPILKYYLLQQRDNMNVTS